MPTDRTVPGHYSLKSLWLQSLRRSMCDGEQMLIEYYETLKSGLGAFFTFIHLYIEEWTSDI
ncbi:MAG: hypothetical protein ACFCU8_15230 [Thermosynechococcaceae cyanobacterium]